MIPLQHYIDALLQGQEHYVQLSVLQTTIIEGDGLPSVSWLKENYVLEADKDTIYPGTNIILPELTDGSKRLWFRESWEQFNGEQVKKQQKLKQMMKEAGLIP